MTQAEKITTLTAMVNDSSVNSGLLTIYLDIAKQSILNKAYPYGVPEDITDVPDKYAYIQIQIACYLVNKRGAEGEISHNENGISRTYGSPDIPNEMLESVVPYVGVLS